MEITTYGCSLKRAMRMNKRVSETVAEIEASPAPKDNLLAYTWCVLEEVEFDHWGIGGNAVTPEVLQAVIEGQT